MFWAWNYSTVEGCIMWKQKATTHYVFNYLENTDGEKDIVDIAEFQENCYECICDFLQVEMDERIEYFLCSSPEMAGELYGDDVDKSFMNVYGFSLEAVEKKFVKYIGNIRTDKGILEMIGRHLENKKFV
jgi:UDP-N-acetylmuramate-alanine ligase